MLLSEDKFNHLSHVILRSLKTCHAARLSGDEALVLRTIKRVLAAQLAEEGEIDRAVRAKLASYARPPVEGSQEWDVLYRKFFEEEHRKRKSVRAR